jgi:hypothetical protein
VLCPAAHAGRSGHGDNVFIMVRRLSRPGRHTPAADYCGPSARSRGGPSESSGPASVTRTPDSELCLPAAASRRGRPSRAGRRDPSHPRGRDWRPPDSDDPPTLRRRVRVTARGSEPGPGPGPQPLRLGIEPGPGPGPHPGSPQAASHPSRAGRTQSRGLVPVPLHGRRRAH